MSCLFSANYNYYADIYDKKRTVSGKSGQTKDQWVFVETMQVGIQTITSDGIRVAATTERYGEKYENVDWLTLKTPKSISRSCRITNIRQKKDGPALFVEEELKGSPPTWYNINGQAPTLGPFGEVIEWTGLISRGEVQGSGT